MSSKADLFLEKALGKDFLESLSKAEIWKPGTKSVNDLEDMKIGLQIVPRTIISLLIRELGSMKVGDNKRIPIFLGHLNITKHERDQYSGDLEEGGKKITEFKFRSLPGVGLVIMSAFELYDMENLLNSHPLPASMPVAPPTALVSPEEDISLKVQKIIDERLALHDLIDRVVEKKMAHKDAMHQMMLTKLTEEIAQTKEAIKITEHKATTAQALAPSIKLPIKNSPVQEFLAKRKAKKEFSIHMTKGEAVLCPDCFQEIFNKSGFSGCVCFGADMNNHVFIKKSEAGIKVSFPKSWDAENIQMLLDILQEKNRR